jgi:hypothetical protein
MVKKKEEDKGIKPATQPENREQQLISLAVNLAEKQLREGTASPSVITHYIKMASRREVLERDILEKQSKLIEAKAKTIVKEKEQEELAKRALEAMKKYSPGSE